MLCSSAFMYMNSKIENSTSALADQFKIQNSKLIIVIVVGNVFCLKVEVFGVGIECGAIALLSELVLIECIIVVVVIVLVVW